MRYAICCVVAAMLLSGAAGHVLGDPKKPADGKSVSGQQFHTQLKKIATDYRKWGRVDDDNTAKWGPLLCRMPFPSKARMSASQQKKTHGQKLYYLWSSDREKYQLLPRKKSVPVGFTIVKESWHPEKTDLKKMPQQYRASLADKTPVVIKSLKGFKAIGRYFPYAEKDGTIYKIGKPAGLFVMTKLDPKTPGTDDGWVYGTLSADGKTVTAAGRIRSCMSCHKKTPHDRLFGLLPGK